MSRYFMVQSWVGSHENEPDYNGNQCGERNVRSSEVVPLYDQYGNANIKAFSDEAIQSRKKTQTKSAFSSIMLADRNYSRLCGLSEQLDAELDQGKIDLESYAAARRNIDSRLQKAWQRCCKERPELIDNEELPTYSFDLKLHTEAPRQLRIDLSVIPEHSVFSKLSDGNSLKILYVKSLTMCADVSKVCSKVVNVAKEILTEGLI